MRHPFRIPVLLLTGVGVLLLVVSAAGIFSGLFLAQRIYALLPPITADADAIGGAAMALGIAALATALVHLAAALGLARVREAGAEGPLVTGIVLCALMAVLGIGWSVAALVSAASGSAPAEAMLPAGIGLLVLAALYGWSAAILSRARRMSRGRI